MKLAAICSAMLIVCLFSVAALSSEEEQKTEKVFIAAIDKDGIQHVDIVGGGYFFSPNHVVVKVNVPVELNVRKEPGIVPHNIVMHSPEAGIVFNQSIHEEPQIILFTPGRTGSFPFYCDKKFLFFESHREKGMEGVLEVTE